MPNYIIRLDDASEYMDLQKWLQMEKLLDKHGIKPIFGIIPKNEDESLLSKYTYNPDFWTVVDRWISKGWIPALHGYEHKYVTADGGINPVNKRSEFAGLPYNQQAQKIQKGYNILYEHGIKPTIFFAPSHTFDNNTIKALYDETPIRIISDTVAWDIYKKGDFWFIPQQTGHVQLLPFRTITCCYHPNTMSENAFERLNAFLEKHSTFFHHALTVESTNRKYSVLDSALSWIYLKMHKH